LIERIERIGGFGFGGSIGGWKAEMGAELLERRPDRQLRHTLATYSLPIGDVGDSTTRHLPR
jgi:hypothetical protein